MKILDLNRKIIGLRKFSRNFLYNHKRTYTPLMVTRWLSLHKSISRQWLHPLQITSGKTHDKDGSLHSAVSENSPTRISRNKFLRRVDTSSFTCRSSDKTYKNAIKSFLGNFYLSVTTIKLTWQIDFTNSKAGLISFFSPSATKGELKVSSSIFITGNRL